MQAGEAHNRADREQNTAHECSVFLEDHAAYMDLCMSEEEAAHHEAHASECTSCGRYARVLERGLAILQELPEIEPSAHFEERLQHRIFHIEDASRLERGSSRSGAGLAAAALIALIAWSPVIWRSKTEHNATRAVADATQRVGAATVNALHSSMEDLVADASHTAGTPHWYVNPTQPEYDQTPVHTFVSNAGTYSPLIVSPPAARGPLSVRLVSARSQ